MKRKKRRMRTNQMVATAIALFITVTFVIALVVNPSSNNSNDQFNTLPPQATFTPAPPPPAAEGLQEANTIKVHATGLFQALEPTGSGWQNYQDNFANDQYPNNDVPNESRANLIYRGRCAVIHYFVEPGRNYPSPQALIDEVFTPQYIEDEWQAYRPIDMIQQEIDDYYVVMDFEMGGTPEQGNCPDDYRGRQISWMDGSLLFNVRLIVADYDSDSLDRLQELILPNFVSYPQNALTLTDNWRARSNVADGYMIQTPPYWMPDNTAAVDRHLGTNDMEGYTLNILTYADTPLTSIQEAEKWLQDFRPDISLLSHEEVSNQQFAQGYRISYTYRNADGDPFSAVVSLLNDAEDKLYVAELSVPGSGIDFLLDDSEDEIITKAKTIINSFTVMAPADYTYRPSTTDEEPEEQIFG